VVFSVSKCRSKEKRKQNREAGEVGEVILQDRRRGQCSHTTSLGITADRLPLLDKLEGWSTHHSTHFTLLAESLVTKRNGTSNNRLVQYKADFQHQDLQCSVKISRITFTRILVNLLFLLWSLTVSSSTSTASTHSFWSVSASSSSSISAFDYSTSRTQSRPPSLTVHLPTTSNHDRCPASTTRLATKSHIVSIDKMPPVSSTASGYYCVAPVDGDDDGTPSPKPNKTEDDASILARLEGILKASIEALQSDEKKHSSTLTKDDTAHLARLILSSMDTPGRVYHSMGHVFEISKPMKDPVLLLSALFHDVIYYSIDKSFSEEQAKALGSTLQRTPIAGEAGSDQPLSLATNLDDQPLVGMVVRLYGFDLGATLPKLGLNEFLSAVIGVNVLSPWLDTPELMQIATCIEATIPFRPTVDGKSPMDRLHDRLKLVCPDQPEEWLVDTVRMAASTANCDLCSFDSDDRKFFMDSSWKLIPEFRPVVLREDCCLKEYHDEMLALEGRTKFLRASVPKIFQSFRQVPSDEEMASKQSKTYENLDMIMEYAHMRMLQLMVLVDFVRAIGEDPASIKLRPLLSMGLPVLEAGTYEIPPPPAGGPTSSLTEEQQDEIRTWLVEGRGLDFSWDPSRSPLAAYLYDRLGGPSGVYAAVEVGKQQREQEKVTPADDTDFDLLKFLPKDAVVTIASCLGNVLPEYVERFQQVPEMLCL